MTPAAAKPILRNVACALFFLALAGAAFVIHFNRMARPPVHIQEEESDTIPRAAVFASLAPEAVCRTYRESAAFGSRAPGQPGLARARDYLLARFRALGLETFTQDVDIPYPLLAEGSGFVSNATFRAAVWPLGPNFAQTVTTGPDGLDGELFVADAASMRTATDFAGKIAVIDVGGAVFGDFGLNPAHYANAGFAAVVYTHQGGLEAADWERVAQAAVLRNLPVNVVRVACGPEILGHAGERVHLEAVSTWCNARTQNVVAVLRAPSSEGHALVIPVQYDAASALPDLAPGSLEAFQAATLVQTAEALASVRDHLRRDVVFAATTGLSQNHLGANRLFSALGHLDRRNQPAIRLAEDVARNESRLAMVEEILAMLGEAGGAPPAFSGSGAVAPRLSKPTQKFLAERFSAAMRDLVFAQSERLLAARIAYQRHPADAASADYFAFRREKALYDRVNSLAGLPLAKAAVADMSAIRPLLPPADCVKSRAENPAVAVLRASLVRLRRFHLDRRATLAADGALVDLFAGYADICGLAPRFLPVADGAAEKLGISHGHDIAQGEAFSQFRALTEDALQDLGSAGTVGLVESEWSGFMHFFTAELDSLPLCAASYPAFSLVTATPARHRSLHPFAQPDYADPARAAARSLRVFADVAARLAGTATAYPRLPMRGAFGVHGSVLAAGVGSSAVPNYAVADALVCARDRKQPVFTDPYGEYDLPFVLLPVNEWDRWDRYDAFLFDRYGRITHAKDYGASAQMLFASTFVPVNYQPLTHILYRGAPVALLDTVNPQSLKAFSAFSFVRAKGLATFGSVCPFSTGDGFMDFLPPDERFYLTLKAGAPQNELVAVTRAFCLGTTATNAPAWRWSGAEIDGPGYLAADTPILAGATAEAIASMAWLTDKRLDLQRRYGIADELTVAFAAKAAKAAGGSASGARGAPPCGRPVLPRGAAALAAPLADPPASAAPLADPALTRLRRQREALSYLILNHPVVRGTISEAVFGILWYLGLLVPFAFFFEKLVFGFADVRRQILAQGAVFLVVFLILRLLHPAFHMIRSSAMILLGFVIILIVGSVLALLSGKFKENLDALRRAQGHVAGAEGNAGGIVLTAFMLGLNNMHRRRVRTGLTCATLVLMTFVMVCFTSVQSDVVDSERAIGRAAYQGIVLRDKDFMPLSPAEIDALKAEFGERHAVCRRTLYSGWYDASRQTLRPAEFTIAAGTGENARRRAARGALGFDAAEPLARSIRLLCTNGWFTAEQARRSPRPVILSDFLAAQLGVTPQMVEAGPVSVTVNGAPFAVHNLFDAASLAAATDADGHDLLPFDVETLTATRFARGDLLLADDASPRLAAADLILVPNDALHADGRAVRTASAVIDMGGAPYSAARAEIVSYMERSGRECHFALGGTAFAGQRARSRTATGYIELLIPLVIAALTVLNTMKGSVYERQNEIYVYNAVGISPRNIFFIFMAESLVYAVVGSVLGYVLSLGAGRLVALTGAGGAAMNFTSATCVHASLAIAAATLLSTWYPARTAMRIAKPADSAGWTLPAPDADGRLTILLPFTFTHDDRIAVLAFFQRYFEGFGEGGAGPFFAAEPELKLADRLDDLADGAYIPALDVRVWLKPFDLGVSQRLEIELATDPETREYIARMVLTRLTGTRDAWLRLNGPFVTAIRRRFLHWRAVSPDQKAELFAAARDALRRACL